MKVPEIQQIVRVAQALPDDPCTPDAFENRIMAAIRAKKPVDVLAFWNQTLWRAALACVGMSIATGVLAQFGRDTSSGDLLAAELERTVLEPLTPDESW
jgi:hypothetical protein